MYYWNYIDMEHVPTIVQEALEDICIIWNGKWDYEDTKFTEKMIRLFKQPDNLLKETMSLEVFYSNYLNCKKKVQVNASENLETLLREVRMRDDWNGYVSTKTLEGQKNICVLSGFLVKMVIYKFCKMYFPQMLDSSEKLEKNKKIRELYCKMEEWEQDFWTLPWSLDVDVVFRSSEIYEKKQCLRNSYTRFYYNKEIEYKNIIECVQRAFEEDMETVEEVKRLQSHYLLGDSQCDSNTSVKEIQNMRHLLDIMERDVKGELTAQDKADLKDKAQEWTQDIEKLICMLKEAGK